MSEHDLVDIGRRNAGIGKRLAGDADDQAFHTFRVELSEGGVGPSNDACGHGIFSIRRLFAALAELSSLSPVNESAGGELFDGDAR
jgi:hypothetical protein